MTIIDNEVSMKHIQSGQRADEEYGEDAPQVLLQFFVWFEKSISRSLFNFSRSLFNFFLLEVFLNVVFQ